MASKVPYDAIMARITSTLGQTYHIAEWDSVVDVLNQQEDNFLAVEDAYSDEEVISVGAPTKNYFEESGELIVHIFVRAAEGYNVARTIASEVVDSLRMQNIGTDVRVFKAGPPNSGLIADGIWSSMVVSIEYRYIHTAPTFA